MLVLGARQQRVTARGGEAAQPLGSSLSLAAQEQQEGRRNVLLLAQAAVDSLVGERGSK